MTAANSGDLIYLKEGHVVGMTLPLRPDIEARWRVGHLTRVHADGSAWQDSVDGDPFAVLSGGPASADDNGTPDTTTTGSGEQDGQSDEGSGQDSEPGQPERPAGNASRRDWAAFAVALGVASEDDAAKLNRAELQQLCTPPELLPPDPGELAS